MLTTFIQTSDTSHKGSFNAYKHDNDVPVANMSCHSHLEIIAQLPHNQLSESPIIILNQSEMLKFVLIKSIETDFLTFGAAWKYLFLQVTFLNFIEKAFAAVKG